MLSQRVATLLIFILSIGSPKPAEHLLIETDDREVASTEENIAGIIKLTHTSMLNYRIEFLIFLKAQMV